MTVMVRQRGRNVSEAIGFSIAMKAIVAGMAGMAIVAGIGPALAEEEGATYARVRHLEDDMTIARAAEGEISAVR